MRQASTTFLPGRTLPAMPILLARALCCRRLRVCFLLAQQLITIQAMIASSIATSPMGMYVPQLWYCRKPECDGGTVGESAKKTQEIVH